MAIINFLGTTIGVSMVTGGITDIAAKHSVNKIVKAEVNAGNMTESEAQQHRHHATKRMLVGFGEIALGVGVAAYNVCRIVEDLGE